MINQPIITGWCFKCNANNKVTDIYFGEFGIAIGLECEHAIGISILRDDVPSHVRSLTKELSESSETIQVRPSMTVATCPECGSRDVNGILDPITKDVIQMRCGDCGARFIPDEADPTTI